LVLLQALYTTSRSVYKSGEWLHNAELLKVNNFDKVVAKFEENNSTYNSTYNPFLVPVAVPESSLLSAIDNSGFHVTLARKLDTTVRVVSVSSQYFTGGIAGVFGFYGIPVAASAFMVAASWGTQYLEWNREAQYNQIIKLGLQNPTTVTEQQVLYAVETIRVMHNWESPWYFVYPEVTAGAANIVVNLGVAIVKAGESVAKISALVNDINKVSEAMGAMPVGAKDVGGAGSMPSPNTGDTLNNIRDGVKSLGAALSSPTEAASKAITNTVLLLRNDPYWKFLQAKWQYQDDAAFYILMNKLEQFPNLLAQHYDCGQTFLHLEDNLHAVLDGQCVLVGEHQDGKTEL
jgi:hypothetical protein